MKTYQVCGLGNAIVDIFVEIDDAEFHKLGFERGTMRLVEAAEQKELLHRFHDKEPRLASGGSVANSIIGFSQLGGKAAFIGCVGDDRYGFFYQREFEHLNIEMGVPIIVEATTGTSVVIITPDAERTMRTCLAVSSHLSERHVDEERIKNSEWLFIEGYVIANPATGQGAVQRAVQLAKRHGVKIALTCSDAFIPNVFGDALFETLKAADLFFCNASEAAAVTKTTTVEESIAKLSTLVPRFVLTDGPHGAHYCFDGHRGHVAAFPCEPKDLTGAGDMFAGAFFYGIAHGQSPEKATRGANFLAKKVIEQIGARLHHDIKADWEFGIRGN